MQGRRYKKIFSRDRKSLYMILGVVLISIFSVLYIGMTKNERDVILSKVLSIIYRFKNK